MASFVTFRQPGQGPTPVQPTDFDAVATAKTLLRTIRLGALATIDAAGGHPFASLASLATDYDGSPLMLLSRLSTHTQNLIADPRASLLMAKTGKGDPLAHPRLTVTGRILEDAAPHLRERFLARHPKAALYAGFGDFAMFRFTIESGHLNGGFARAAKLSAEELATDLAGAEALIVAEAGAVAHMNADHADAMQLYASGLLGLRTGRWRMTGLDPEGGDLALRDETARLAFPERVADAAGLRRVLRELADKARSVTG